MGRFLSELYEFGISLLNVVSWFGAIVFGSAIALTIHTRLIGAYSGGIGTWLIEEGVKLIGVYGGGTGTWLIQEAVQGALFAISVWGIVATHRQIRRKTRISEQNRGSAERKSEVTIGGRVAGLFEFVVGLSPKFFVGTVIVVMVFFASLSIFVLNPTEEKKADAAFSRVFSKLLAEQSRDQIDQALADLFPRNNPLPAKTANRAKFAAYCCRQMLFASTRYDLQLEYDMGNKLSFARLLKSHDSDGQNTSCSVLSEMPAIENKAYPYPCPANVQDF